MPDEAKTLSEAEILKTADRCLTDFLRRSGRMNEELRSAGATVEQRHFALAMVAIKLLAKFTILEGLTDDAEARMADAIESYRYLVRKHFGTGKAAA